MILERMLSTQAGIPVCWLGNLSWLIYAESHLVAFDLDLDSGHRLQASPIPTAEIALLLDVHFITHEHGDHFNAITSGILVGKSNCLFVLPANCVEKARWYLRRERRQPLLDQGLPGLTPGDVTQTYAGPLPQARTGRGVCH